MQDGQWWRGGTRPGVGGGVGGGGAYVVTIAAHNAGRWAASVRGSAWDARCARRSMRVGTGPYHGTRERLGCRRGKGAGERMGVSPFDLCEVPRDKICRCGRSVPFSTRLGQTSELVKIDGFKKNRPAPFVLLDLFTFIMNDRDPQYQPVT